MAPPHVLTIRRLCRSAMECTVVNQSKRTELAVSHYILVFSATKTWKCFRLTPIGVPMTIPLEFASCNRKFCRAHPVYRAIIPVHKRSSLTIKYAYEYIHHLYPLLRCQRSSGLVGETIWLAFTRPKLDSFIPSPDHKHLYTTRWCPTCGIPIVYTADRR